MLNKNCDALADVSLLGLQLRVTEDSKGSISLIIAGASPSPDLTLLVEIMGSNKNVFTENEKGKPTTLGVRANSVLLGNVETKFRSH